MYIKVENERILSVSTFKLDESYFEVIYDYYEFIDKPINYWLYVDNEIIQNPDFIDEEEKKERERIANLTMTALDFINVLKQAGLTLEQINNYLDAHIDLKTQLIYCQNVYCGVVLQLCPLTVEGIKITSKMVIEAFKNKHGENEE